MLRHTHAHTRQWACTHIACREPWRNTTVTGDRGQHGYRTRCHTVLAVSSPWLDVHPQINIAACVHLPSPAADTFLWTLLFRCATPWKGGSDARWSRGQAACLEQWWRWRRGTGDLDPTLWQWFARGENNSLGLDIQYAFKTHLDPNDWWRNLCKELENTYFELSVHIWRWPQEKEITLLMSPSLLRWLFLTSRLQLPEPQALLFCSW